CPSWLLVSVLVPAAPEMVTFAPVTTAPEESTTMPDRLPRTDDSAELWEKAGSVSAETRARTIIAVTNLLVISDSFQKIGDPHRTIEGPPWIFFRIEVLSAEARRFATSRR